MDENSSRKRTFQFLDVKLIGDYHIATFEDPLNVVRQKLTVTIFLLLLLLLRLTMRYLPQARTKCTYRTLCEIWLTCVKTKQNPVYVRQQFINEMQPAFLSVWHTCNLESRSGSSNRVKIGRTLHRSSP